jgi:hypothetical protein
MFKYLTVLLVALSSNVVHGQASVTSPKVRKSNLQIGVGLQHTRMIDEGYTDSKLLFLRTNFAFRLGYGRETSEYIFNFTTFGSIGQIQSKSGDLPSDFYFGQIAVEYLRKISEYRLFNKENRFFVGIHLSTINQGVINLRVIDNVSIFSLHGIYLGLRNNLSLNEKHSIQLSYSLPVAVYENRVLWNGGANPYTYREIENIPRLMTTKGETSYFAILDNVQINVDYSIKIRDHTRFEIRYGFFYASNSIEAPLNIYANQLLAGLKFDL